MNFTAALTTGASALTCATGGTVNFTWAASSTWPQPTNEAALRRVDVDRVAA